jgi:hypothetical protein
MGFGAKGLISLAAFLVALSEVSAQGIIVIIIF